jgi:hypothetical protein
MRRQCPPAALQLLCWYLAAAMPVGTWRCPANAPPMPGRYHAATLPLPCRCHSGRHVALPCQCPANARPPSCRYLAAAMTMHGQCTANARPVHGRCNAATKPDRHSAAMPVPCQCTAGTSLAATCTTRPPCLHLGAALPMHGRCSVRFVAATSQVPRRYTWPAPDCY